LIETFDKSLNVLFIYWSIEIFIKYLMSHISSNMTGTNGFIEAVRETYQEFATLDREVSLSINNFIDGVIGENSRGSLSKSANKIVNITQYDPLCLNVMNTQFIVPYWKKTTYVPSKVKQRKKTIKPWLRYSSKKDVYRRLGGRQHVF